MAIVNLEAVNNEAAAKKREPFAIISLIPLAKDLTERTKNGPLDWIYENKLELFNKSRVKIKFTY